MKYTQQANKNILKLCPFCGNEPILTFYNEYDIYDHDLNMFRDEKILCIKCINCDIRTKYYENNDINIKKAKEDWNSRIKRETTYNEIFKILLNNHKAFKSLEVLNEREAELINDYITCLDEDIKRYFENLENEQ